MCPAQKFKVFVTGGSGFIGRPLVERLQEEGYEVLSPGHEQVDITNYSGLLEYLQMHRPDIVYHLAASTEGRFGHHALKKVAEVNTLGTVNLLDASIKSQVARLIAIGTGDEVGTLRGEAGPRSVYAASKCAAAAFLKAATHCSPLRPTVLRLFAVYGPGQSADFFIPQLIKSAASRTILSMTAGMQKREFVWLHDAVEVLVRAAHLEGIEGRIIDVCHGTPVSLREVVEIVAELAGVAELASYGTKQYRESELYSIPCDPAPFRAIFPDALNTSLREGLGRLLEIERKTGS